MTGALNATAVKASRAPTAGMPDATVSRLFLVVDGRTRKDENLKSILIQKPGDGDFLFCPLEQAQAAVFPMSLKSCRMDD